MAEVLIEALKKYEEIWMQASALSFKSDYRYNTSICHHYGDVRWLIHDEWRAPNASPIAPRCQRWGNECEIRHQSINQYER